MALEQGATAGVMIGTRTTDMSHQLVWKRGVWLCTSCGGYAKATLDAKSTCIKLASPCRPPTASGRSVLSRFAKGETPKPGMPWPMQDYGAAARQADSMEVLWPDMRRGSEARRKRNRPEAQEAEDSVGPSSGSAGPDRVVVPRIEQEVSQSGNDGDSALCQFFAMLDEDEDPWGDAAQQGLDSDEEL